MATEQTTPTPEAMAAAREERQLERARLAIVFQDVARKYDFNVGTPTRRDENFATEILQLRTQLAAAQQRAEEAERKLQRFGVIYEGQGKNVDAWMEACNTAEAKLAQAVEIIRELARGKAGCWTKAGEFVDTLDKPAGGECEPVAGEPRIKTILRDLNDEVEHMQADYRGCSDEWDKADGTIADLRRQIGERDAEIERLTAIEALLQDVIGDSTEWKRLKDDSPGSILVEVWSEQWSKLASLVTPLKEQTHA